MKKFMFIGTCVAMLIMAAVTLVGLYLVDSLQKEINRMRTEKARAARHLNNRPAEVVPEEEKDSTQNSETQ